MNPRTGLFILAALLTGCGFGPSTTGTTDDAATADTSSTRKRPSVGSSGAKPRLSNTDNEEDSDPEPTPSPSPSESGSVATGLHFRDAMCTRIILSSKVPGGLVSAVPAMINFATFATADTIEIIAKGAEIEDSVVFSNAWVTPTLKTSNATTASTAKARTTIAPTCATSCLKTFAATIPAKTQELTIDVDQARTDHYLSISNLQEQFNLEASRIVAYQGNVKKTLYSTTCVNHAVVQGWATKNIATDLFDILFTEPGDLQ